MKQKPFVSHLEQDFNMFRILFISLIFVLTLAPMSFAQDKVTTSGDVAVVDVVILLRDSKAAKSIELQIQEKRKSFKNEISAQEKELRKLEEELIEQKDKIKPEKFTEKRKVFEKKLRELQANTQKKRFALDKSAGKAITQLQTEITNIVGQIAKDNDYKIVITRDQVVVVTSDIDITDEVMVALDKKISKIKVEAE